MGCFNYGGFNITQLLSLPFFVDSDRLSQELIIFRARIKKTLASKKRKKLISLNLGNSYLISLYKFLSTQSLLPLMQKYIIIQTFGHSKSSRIIFVLRLQRILCALRSSQCRSSALSVP